jgi:TolB-like protein/tetratricopeptide (TPR) repeat protein
VRFVDELKRRNVFRVAVTYLAVAFGVIQLLPPVVDAFELPKWSVTFVFLMMGLGFPITILVTWAFEMTPEGLRRTGEVDQHRQVVRTSANPGDYFVLAAIVVILGYMVYSFRGQDAAPVQAGVPVVGTVAVLPFANLSVEPEQEGMSRAITSDVRNRLARVPGLKVIAGPASQKPGEDEDLKAIGAKLDAPVVLDGSVQRSGSRLRVMAQLVDTRNGVQIWSKTFNRDVADILAVQDDLSQAIVGDVRKVVVPAGEGPEPGQGARQLVDAARASLARRTGASLSASVAALEQAISRNPKSAYAYAAMAEARLLQGKGWETYGAVPMADAVAAAAPFAAKALRLDPGLAEARAVTGLVQLASGQTDAAIASLRAAVAAKPALTKAHLWLYQAYAAAGRTGEAAGELKHAYRLDPNSLAVGLNMSRLMAMSDRRLEADTLLGRLERRYPGNENLLAARGARLADDGRSVDAIQVLRRALAADPGDEKVRALLGHAYLDVGAPAEAARWLPEGKSMVLLAQGRPADALDEARRRFDADPGDPARIFALADAQAAAGHSQAVIDLLAPFEPVSGGGTGPLYGRTPLDMPAITLAAARRATGDEAGAKVLLDGAKAWLQRQRSLGFSDPALAYLEARIEAMQGNPQDAVAALRRAAARRFAGLAVMGWDPALASLRALPAYREIAADLDADRAQRRARLADMGLLTAL